MHSSHHTPLSAENFPPDWFLLDTRELFDRIYGELLQNLPPERRMEQQVIAETRRKALTLITNLKYGQQETFYKHRLENHPIHSSNFLEALRRVDLRLGSTIVDMGVNDGFEFAALAEYGGKQFLEYCTVYGIDISSDAIQRARLAYSGNNIHLLHGDGETLEGTDSTGSTVRIPDACADLYLCFNSLQSSLIDRRKALQNALRVLKKDGKVLITIPRIHRRGKDVNDDIKRAAIIDEIQSFLEYANMDVEILGPNERYTFIIGIPKIYTS